MVIKERVRETRRTGLATLLCVLMTAGLGTGCMSWRPQWPGTPPAAVPKNTTALQAEADRLGAAANSRDSINTAIAAYQTVLAVDPFDYHACVSLAQLHLLLGDGFTSSVAEKRRHFRKAMLYAEQGLYTNPSFRQGIQQGEPIWDACRRLGTREMEAMLFWVNSIFYSYKEGQSSIGQVINFRWIRHAKQVMDHMTSLDPDWGGGILHFTWGIYYLSIPEMVGGDRVKSAEYLNKAIQVGPSHLIHRWGRAKYYCVKMNNPQEFQKDLEWVLAQDISKSPGNSSWNSFFVQDARRLLDSKKQLF